MSEPEGIEGLRVSAAPPQVVRRFDPSPRHVREARELVVRLMTEHHWPAESIERAKTVVSELASNAVLHARTPFQVRCWIEGDAVIEVTDWQPDSVPLVADPDQREHGGRGLRLVSAYVSEWGIETANEFKVVWCRIPRIDAETP